MIDRQIILVSGASSGMGAACALRLARAGHQVIGVSRSGTVPRDPYGVLPPENLTARVLDLRDREEVEQTVNAVAGDFGRLDAIVSAGGIAIAGPFEDASPALIRDQIETNLLGPIHLIHAALPHLRRFAPTRLVQVSSIASRVALPYQAAYSATQAAVSALCQSLRYELEPQGVRVVVIEPGNVRTGLTANRRTSIGGDTYRAAAESALRINDKDELSGIDADRVARAVERALTARSHPYRCSVAHWHERITIPLERLLPARCFRRVIAAHYLRGVRK
jgi:NAD(P)-dependent dehydrogenase (short-subunit alcohol dehydrogenase family)